MNPNNPKDRRDLADSIEHHYKELSPFRVDRERQIRDYAGPYFGVSRPDLATLVNFTLQTAQIHTLALAANRPGYLIRPLVSNITAFAARFQVAIRNLIREISLEVTLEQIVLDAFFGPGIAKTFHGDSPLVVMELDRAMDPGRPYVKRISQDMWFHDTDATDFREITMAGDRYRVPYHYLLNNVRFDQKVVQQLESTSKHDNTADEALAKNISRGDATDKGEAFPYLDLMDVWYPDEKMIITWACDKRFCMVDSNPLAVQEMSDPEEGPYDFLNLGPVPDHIMPTTPASNLRNLCLLLNSLLWKEKQSAESWKQLTLYRGNEADTAQRMKDAPHGAHIRSEDPTGVNVVTKGGVDPGMTMFRENMTLQYDRAAGNLQSKGGLGAQAPTATQEGMMREEVAEQEAGARNKVNRFTVDVGTKLGYLMWIDEYLYLTGEMDVKGLRPVPSNWTPEQREGEFANYEIAIEPNSMRYVSQEQRSQKLQAIVAGMIPLMPAGEAQGVAFDLSEYVHQLADLESLPGLNRVFKTTVPPPMEAAANERPPRAANTTRTHQRINVSTGGTPESRNHQLLQQAMPGKSAANLDQQAALARGN